MEYIPLLPEYANFIVPLMITAAISSVVIFVYCRLWTSMFEEVFLALCMSLLCAFVIGGAAGFIFSYAPNVTGNLQTVKVNIETKYDVSISNVEKLKGDDDATMFSAAIVSNKDQSARDITLLIASDGTPSIISTDGFKAETVER